MKKLSKREANKVSTPNIMAIQFELAKQNTANGQTYRNFGNKAQLQFILSNEHYASAALVAIRTGKIEAAIICPTGFGGYSFEMVCTRDTVDAVRSAYNDHCDALGLY